MGLRAKVSELCVPAAEANATAASDDAPVSVTRRRPLPSERTADPLERARILVTLAVRRVTGARDHEFEDIVQTSLATLLVALGERGFHADCSAPWILCVARNIAIDRLRARERERRMFERSDGMQRFVPSARALEPDHLTYVRAELRRFDTSLRRMGARKSMVVYMHDVLGHGLAEIAPALGISVAAAQSRLIRGRRALESELFPPRKRRSLPTPT
jgi:RNA polymerase sigma factor (sigma-70 family)